MNKEIEEEEELAIPISSSYPCERAMKQVIEMVSILVRMFCMH